MAVYSTGQKKLLPKDMLLINDFTSNKKKRNRLKKKTKQNFLKKLTTNKTIQLKN